MSVPWPPKAGHAPTISIREKESKLLFFVHKNADFENSRLPCFAAVQKPLNMVD
jgi:hypothetical protein